jgi:hypothetical protein
LVAERAARLAEARAALWREHDRHVGHRPAVAVLDAHRERRVGQDLAGPALAPVAGDVAERQVLRPRTEVEPQRVVLADVPGRADSLERCRDALDLVRVLAELPGR